MSGCLQVPNGSGHLIRYILAATVVFTVPNLLMAALFVFGIASFPEEVPGLRPDETGDWTWVIAAYVVFAVSLLLAIAVAIAGIARVTARWRNRPSGRPGELI